MDKGNVVDFVVFRSRQSVSQQPKEGVAQDDLGLALQELIHRVREGNPIKHTHNIAISNFSSK